MNPEPTDIMIDMSAVNGPFLKEMAELSDDKWFLLTLAPMFSLRTWVEGSFRYE